jgi:TRAP-type C4-dicarboxylate transport system substrate-binding protein
MIRFASVLLALAWLVASAHADPIKLRLASVGPDGSSWAREVKAFSREVEKTTHGNVVTKWYLGGIAGDELEMLERTRRGQLDGFAAATVCPRLAHSLRAFLLPGLFPDAHQAGRVLSRLFPTVSQEVEANGYVLIAQVMLGSIMTFSRTPIQNVGELTKTPLYLWDADEILLQLLPKMGLHVVPTPVARGLELYDQKQVDGFVTSPTAALAFQWSARSGSFNDLPVAFLPGCLLISRRAFDQIPFADQQAVRAAGATLSRRIEDVMLTQEEDLVGGLLERQGLKRVRATPAYRDQVFERGRTAWKDTGLVSQQLLDTIKGWLSASPGG